MFRCTACNSVIKTPKKKRPVTTLKGHMDSQSADKIEDFPSSDYEDLCNVCIQSIRNLNASTSDEVYIVDFHRMKPDDHIEELSEVRLDVEFRQVNAEYQGYYEE